MPSFTLHVTATLDGADLVGYPIVRRATVDKTQSFQITVASSSTTTTWTALPMLQLSTIKVLTLFSDQPVLARYADQGDAIDRPSLPISGGGNVIFWDVAIREGNANGSFRLNNTSGVTANVTGVAGGS